MIFLRAAATQQGVFVEDEDLAGVLGQNRGPTINFAPLVTPRVSNAPIPRPEGNFGTGAGSLSLQLKH